MDSDADGDPVHRTASVFEEERELSDTDHDLKTADIDQALFEEQPCRETVCGIKSFMGWTHILDMDNSSSADDNPFSAPKQQPLGKISVKLPTNEWLYRKMDKLNETLVEGLPSRASEAGGLQKDQFVNVGKSQSKWYGPHSSKEMLSGSASSWGSESVKLNSSYSRIARLSHLSTPVPASRPICQDTLRRWEKSAQGSTYICNQVNGFSRCPSKVQSVMQAQLRVIQAQQSKEILRKDQLCYR